MSEHIIEEEFFPPEFHSPKLAILKMIGYYMVCKFNI